MLQPRREPRNPHPDGVSVALATGILTRAKISATLQSQAGMRSLLAVLSSFELLILNLICEIQLVTMLPYEWRKSLGAIQRNIILGPLLHTQFCTPETQPRVRATSHTCSRTDNSFP